MELPSSRSLVDHDAASAVAPLLLYADLMPTFPRIRCPFKAAFDQLVSASEAFFLCFPWSIGCGNHGDRSG
jgi:hypothetical protein